MKRNTYDAVIHSQGITDGNGAARRIKRETWHDAKGRETAREVTLTTWSKHYKTEPTK